MNILESYFFVNVLLPLVAAYICMVFNSINSKDHRIPNTLKDKLKNDLYDITNFAAIWVTIIVLMQIYKAYLKSVWGIE